MKAQAVLNNPEASEAEVKAAHAALTKALEELEAKLGIYFIYVFFFLFS